MSRILRLLKNTSKFGVLMGLSFCLYTTLMWLFQLDSTYLNIGQYLDILIIFLPIVMTFRAIRQENRSEKLNILHRFIIAIFVSLISFLIYDPFLYAYHHFINPDWFDSVLQLKETELKAANTDAKLIAEQLEQMKQSNAKQSVFFRLSALIPSVIVIPMVIVFLSFIFIWRKKKID